MLSVEHFQSRLNELISLIQVLVEMESPTTDKAAVDRVVTYMAEQAEYRGGRIERFRQESAGDHLAASWGEIAGGILLLTHLDTVHPIGTLARMPFGRDGRKLTGPGVFDMKASVAMALHVIQALVENQHLPAHRITLLCTSDEETGSRSSRDLIERMARQHELVLCLEPGLADGSLKTRRKGIGVFNLEATGIPTHAGANPEGGVSAILEMCHQILWLDQLNDPGRGVSLNAGKIHGGSRSNVIPEHCRVEIDVRIPSKEAGEWVEAKLASIYPVQERAKVAVDGGWNRPPMPRTSAIAEAYNRAEVVASELGLDIGEGESGGGSDANFVAPLGIPLLDGLGPIGAGAHSNDEYLWVDSLPRRSALLAGLLSRDL